MSKTNVNDFPDISKNDDDLVAPGKGPGSDDEFERQDVINKRGPKFIDFKKRIALMEQEISHMTSLNDKDSYDDSVIDSHIQLTNTEMDNNNGNTGFHRDSNTIKNLNDALNKQQKILDIEQISNNNNVNEIDNDNNENKDDNNNNSTNSNDPPSESKDSNDDTALPPDQYPKTLEEQKEIDSRSIFVSNLDKAADASEVKKHFEVCGPIERITIVCEKFNGKPKGCAYIQYKKKDSRTAALLLDGKEFNGVALKVQEKRTNQPRWMRGQPRGRGRGRGYRGYRGRGRGRGGAPSGYYYTGYQPYFGRGFSRGYYGHWAPY